MGLAEDVVEAFALPRTEEGGDLRALRSVFLSKPQGPPTRDVLGADSDSDSDSDAELARPARNPRERSAADTFGGTGRPRRTAQTARARALRERNAMLQSHRDVVRCASARTEAFAVQVRALRRAAGVRSRYAAPHDAAAGQASPVARRRLEGEGRPAAGSVGDVCVLGDAGAAEAAGGVPAERPDDAATWHLSGAREALLVDVLRTRDIDDARLEMLPAAG